MLFGISINFSIPLFLKRFSLIQFAYIRLYFSKTENQSSQAIKQGVKEDFENIIHQAIESVLYRRQFIMFCQN